MSNKSNTAFYLHKKNDSSNADAVKPGVIMYTNNADATVINKIEKALIKANFNVTKEKRGLKDDLVSSIGHSNDIFDMENAQKIFHIVNKADAGMVNLRYPSLGFAYFTPNVYGLNLVKPPE